VVGASPFLNNEEINSNWMYNLVWKMVLDLRHYVQQGKLFAGFANMFIF
jgi:hypothetical protein